MKEKVSVIIPTYNPDQTIIRCVKSITDQTYSNIEIIIIDDGSEAKGAIKELSKKFGNSVKIIENKHGGVSNARNKGIEESSGKYILFIDSDDYIDETLIDELINNISANSIIIPRRNSDTKKINTTTGENYIKMMACGKAQGFCTGILFRNKQIRFPSDTGYMEDAVYLIRQIKLIKTIKSTKAKYYFGDNKKSITRSSEYTNIINNLLSVHTSIGYLKKEIPQYEKALNIKEYRITESLLAKVKDRESLKKILKNKRIHEQLNEHKKEHCVYKIPLVLAARGYTNCLFAYIEIRNVIKKVPSWIRTRLNYR